MNAYPQLLVLEARNKLEHNPPNMQTLYQTAPRTVSPPSSVTASTPSLVARSLTSSPSTSTSTTPDDCSDVLYRAEGKVDDSHDLDDPSLCPFSFDTDDHSEPWFTGKTLLSYAHYAQLHHISPLPAAGFVPNPHALPYLPTITRKRCRIDREAYKDVKPCWRPHHPWLRPMRSGTVAQHRAVRQGLAKVVIHAGLWDTSLVSELAGKFIERAAEGLSSETHCVAAFARCVFDEFRQSHGDGIAEMFAQQLRQCLLSEFRAWWLQALPSSIYNIPTRSTGPLYAPPHRHISSALAVAEFAGDLFAHSLAAGHYILLCINVLLDRLAILEEVYALHTIVHHAGEAMYSRLQMIDFVNKLHRRAATIAPGASVVGHPNVVAEVARLVEDLTRLINDWARARVTPSPSECSDLASEYSDHNPDMARYQEDSTLLASESMSSSAPEVPPGLGIFVTPPTRSDQQVQEITTRTEPLSNSNHPPSVGEACEKPIAPPPSERSPSWAQVVRA